MYYGLDFGRVTVFRCKLGNRPIVRSTEVTKESACARAAILCWMVSHLVLLLYLDVVIQLAAIIFKFILDIMFLAFIISNLYIQ